MHPDLSPHLHTDECNKVITELHNCYEEHKVGKFFGQCSSLYKQMTVCLKNEREIYRKRNQAKQECSDGSSYNPSLIAKRPQAEGYIAIVLPNIVNSCKAKEQLMTKEDYESARGIKVD
ncbi:Hypothetical predicted protein [Cloeon dipterum]|uniref:COX assembly mitochondrial protein n=1 Tax=Cloeon dipterum TaxID=197152 RepID=A0A8S1BUG8_9INSE|nr:Hypothetical predicted protein [Cloeon dipterum]